MSIALVALSLCVATFLYSQYRSLKSVDQPELPPWLVPRKVGKERNTGGSVRDASMYTQSVRRGATVNGHYASGRTMKETVHTTGFTNGVVEVFSIGSICTRICAAVVETIAPLTYDGGNAQTEGQIWYDGNVGGVGQMVIDGGGAFSTFLNDMFVYITALDGGGANTDHTITADGNE
jgi:hypothetical protein